MEIELNKYEKAVGPMRASQLSLQLFIEDTTNNLGKRKYAETIYELLGSLELTIDELFEESYEKSVFILEILKKYELNKFDSNIILNYIDAVESLTYQQQHLITTTI